MPKAADDANKTGQQTNPGYPGGIKPGQEPDLKPGKVPDDGAGQTDVPDPQGERYTR